MSAPGTPTTLTQLPQSSTDTTSLLRTLFGLLFVLVTARWFQPFSFLRLLTFSSYSLVFRVFFPWWIPHEACRVTLVFSFRMACPILRYDRTILYLLLHSYRCNGFCHALFFWTCKTVIKYFIGRIFLFFKCIY